MSYFYPFGQSEGKNAGPKLGDGADLYHNSGEADFDGLPGDVLPPRRDIETGANAPRDEAVLSQR